MAAPKGNINAAKAKVWEGAVRFVLAKDRERLKRIAETVVAAAEKGEQWAVTEIRNTLDGKPKETVDITVEKIDRSPVERLRSHLRPANTESRTVN